MNKKIMVALLASAFALSMLVTTDANAHCRYYHDGYYHHYYYYGCSGGMPLVYRVVRRLRADPSTYDQRIWVAARGHVVMLSGGVGNIAIKYRAIDITRYTCGVRLVVDRLHVIQPSY